MHQAWRILLIHYHDCSDELFFRLCSVSRGFVDLCLHGQRPSTYHIWRHFITPDHGRSLATTRGIRKRSPGLTWEETCRKRLCHGCSHLGAQCTMVDGNRFCFDCRDVGRFSVVDASTIIRMYGKRVYKYALKYWGRACKGIGNVNMIYQHDLQDCLAYRHKRGLH